MLIADESPIAAGVAFIMMLVREREVHEEV